ncbi:MAG TPA: helix-turn-helix domain-containing protein [Nocardioides sp.]|uniref:TetR/AcrR family transcriptional regulator n=1 Tax=Nocardioides sp. TaxID=35761 RepID=UPI002EDB6A73
MASRDSILSAAQRQLNQDPTASMAVVAEAAGVGRATLHRHFATREALLTEIGTRSLDRWQSHLDERDVAAVAASADPGRIAECLAALIRDFVADADDFGFALTDTYMCAEPALTARAEALFAREVELYAAAQAAGVLRGDVSARWIGHAIYGLLVAARDAIRAGDVARRDLDGVVLSTFLTGGAAR